MSPSAIENDGNIVYDDSPNGQQNSKSAVLHRDLHHDPLKVVGGAGNYLELSNGQQYA
jgi:hypothetical protein